MATPKSTKRIAGAKGLRQLTTELEDVITPSIVDAIESSSRLSETLTGAYDLDTESSKKTTTITLYAKTRDKAPREKVVKDLLEIVEDYMLDVDHKDFNVVTSWEKDSKFTTGVLKVKIQDGDTDKHIIKYGIKPESGAKESLYSVLAQECLQVVGCAYLQANGSIDETDFTNFLNYAYRVEKKEPTSAENDTKWKQVLNKVEDTTDYGPKANSQVADIYNFGIGDQAWVQSTVTTAKTLEPLYKSGKYYFCHADSAHVNWMWNAYKDARDQVLKNKDVFGGVGAQQMDRNKWNPADMFAMKGGWVKYSFPVLKNRAKRETNAVSEKSLKYNMRSNGIKKIGKIDIGEDIKKKAESAKTVEGLPSLNQFLLNQAKSGEFYPISLKKVGKSAHLHWMNDTEVEVTMEATLQSVEWKNDYGGKATNKVEVHFLVDVEGKETDYYINARQFNEGADIKLQIEKQGALAFHGKVGLKMSAVIINKTDSKMRNSLLTMRRRLHNTKKKFKVSTELFSTTSDIAQTWVATKDRQGKSNVLLDYVGLLSKSRVTKIPLTETGHISKVQATEFGYVINKADERGFSSYILYSLFTYAGSRGLVLFNKGNFENHFASSVHIKVM